jgi:hypothetical protein
MALVAGCSSTANTPPPTQQDEDAIRDQFLPCWTFPTGIERPENYRVNVDIEISPAGKVTKWTVHGEAASQLSDPTYLAVLQQAVHAVTNPACQPVRFPSGKYWPNITIVFDPSDLK